MLRIAINFNVISFEFYEKNFTMKVSSLGKLILKLRSQWFARRWIGTLRVRDREQSPRGESYSEVSRNLVTWYCISIMTCYIHATYTVMLTWNATNHSSKIPNASSSIFLQDSDKMSTNLFVSSGRDCICRQESRRGRESKEQDDEIIITVLWRMCVKVNVRLAAYVVRDQRTRMLPSSKNFNL